MQKRKKMKQSKKKRDYIFKITLSQQQYVVEGIPEGFMCVPKVKVIRINSAVEKNWIESLKGVGK